MCLNSAEELTQETLLLPEEELRSLTQAVELLKELELDESSLLEPASSNPGKAHNPEASTSKENISSTTILINFPRLKEEPKALKLPQVPKSNQETPISPLSQDLKSPKPQELINSPKPLDFNIDSPKAPDSFLSLKPDKNFDQAQEVTRRQLEPEKELRPRRKKRVMEQQISENTLNYQEFLRSFPQALKAYNESAGLWAQSNSSYHSGGIQSNPFDKKAPEIVSSIYDFSAPATFPETKPDWQEAWEQVLQEPEGLDQSRKLLHILESFYQRAEAGVRLLYSERGLAEEQRSVQPLEDAKNRYLISGILFQLPYDPDVADDAFLYGGRFPSSRFAGKALENEIRTSFLFQQILRESQLPCNIVLPLSVLIEYMGLKILAVAHLPISPRSIRFGTTDGKFVHVGTDAKLSESMKAIGKALNLREHYVAQTKKLTGPADIQIHQSESTISTFYAIHLRHTFPPEQPTGLACFGTEIHHKLLRPEFTKNYQAPLSSHAFSAWISKDPQAEAINKDMVAATRQIYSQTIPLFSGKIDLIYQTIAESGKAPNFEIGELSHSAGINLRMMYTLLLFCFFI